MDATASPDLEATLAELADFAVRTARAVARMVELEQQAAETVAAWLPTKTNPDASLADAIAAGQAIDAFAATMAASVPRVEILSRALDRLTRSARRSIALRRRLQTGWPRAGSSDNQAAMRRRQVANAVSEKIRAEATDDATENLFADLAERLDDPGLDEELKAFSIEEVVQRISRDIGLAEAAVQAIASQSPTPDNQTQGPAPPLQPQSPSHLPDSG